MDAFVNSVIRPNQWLPRMSTVGEFYIRSGAASLQVVFPLVSHITLGADDNEDLVQESLVTCTGPIRNSMYNQLILAHPGNEITGSTPNDLGPEVAVRWSYTQPLKAPIPVRSWSLKKILTPAQISDKSEIKIGSLYLAPYGACKHELAVILFPGNCKGGFSIDNTDLLGLMERCCSYDSRTNTKSCLDEPGLLYYPIQYFNTMNPEDREVEWEVANNLEALEPNSFVPVPYMEMVSEYMDLVSVAPAC